MAKNTRSGLLGDALHAGTPEQTTLETIQKIADELAVMDKNNKSKYGDIKEAAKTLTKNPFNQKARQRIDETKKELDQLSYDTEIKMYAIPDLSIYYKKMELRGELMSLNDKLLPLPVPTTTASSSSSSASEASLSASSSSAASKLSPGAAKLREDVAKAAEKIEKFSKASGNRPNPREVVARAKQGTSAPSAPGSSSSVASESIKPAASPASAAAIEDIKSDIALIKPSAEVLRSRVSSRVRTILNKIPYILEVLKTPVDERNAQEYLFARRELNFAITDLGVDISVIDPNWGLQLITQEKNLKEHLEKFAQGLPALGAVEALLPSSAASSKATTTPSPEALEVNRLRRQEVLRDIQNYADQLAEIYGDKPAYENIKEAARKLTEEAHNEKGPYDQNAKDTINNAMKALEDTLTYADNGERLDISKLSNEQGFTFNIIFGLKSALVCLIELLPPLKAEGASLAPSSAPTTTTPSSAASPPSPAKPAAAAPTSVAASVASTPAPAKSPKKQRPEPPPSRSEGTVTAASTRSSTPPRARSSKEQTPEPNSLEMNTIHPGTANSAEIFAKLKAGNPEAPVVTQKTRRARSPEPVSPEGSLDVSDVSKKDPRASKVTGVIQQLKKYLGKAKEEIGKVKAKPVAAAPASATASVSSASSQSTSSVCGPVPPGGSVNADPPSQGWVKSKTVGEESSKVPK
ncbi:MAG: hypothetical protein WCW01_02155 [Gammaproteobacteria bacterium]